MGQDQSRYGDQAVARARLKFECDRANGVYDRTWTTAAKVEQALELGWSWEKIDEKIYLGGTDARVPERAGVWAMWQMRIGQNPEMVAAARQLLEEGTYVLARGQTWEVTTVHGTRLILDLRRERPRWMRWPGVHGDGEVNAQPTDGNWQRLFGMHPSGHVRRDDAERQWYVEIGVPLVIYKGFLDWWRTTEVVSVRELHDAEVAGTRERAKLLLARREDSHSWRIHATAARIEMLQEQGLPWDEIDDLLGLSDRGGDRLETQAGWERVMNQDADIVVAARSIIEEEARG